MPNQRDATGAIRVTDEMVDRATTTYLENDDGPSASMREALTVAFALVPPSADFRAGAEWAAWIRDTRADMLSVEAVGLARSIRTALAALPELLWCCHVRGPDDLVACADYASTIALADVLLRYDRQPGRHEYDPYFSAVPAVWPLGRAAHAEDLAKRALPGSDYPISLAEWPETIPERRAPSPQGSGT